MRIGNKNWEVTHKLVNGDQLTIGQNNFLVLVRCHPCMTTEQKLLFCITWPPYTVMNWNFYILICINDDIGNSTCRNEAVDDISKTVTAEENNYDKPQTDLYFARGTIRACSTFITFTNSVYMYVYNIVSIHLLYCCIYSTIAPVFALTSLRIPVNINLEIEHFSAI